MASTFSATYEEKLAAMKERARLAAEKKKLEKKQSAKANKNPKKKSGKGTKKAPVKNKAPIISKLNSVQNLPDAAAPSDAPVIVQWTRISSESPDLETGNKNEESTARSDPQYIPLLFGHDFSTNKSETNIPVVQEQVSNPAVRMEAPATQSSNSATLDAPQTPQSRSSADLQNKSNRVDVIISPGSCGRDEMYPAHKKCEFIIGKNLNDTFCEGLCLMCMCICAALTRTRQRGGKRAHSCPLPLQVKQLSQGSSSRDESETMGPSLHAKSTSGEEEFSQQNQYSGIFMDYCVWVTDVKHMHALYMQGCFGKGYLSRSMPEPLQKTKRDAKTTKRKRGDDGLNSTSSPLPQTCPPRADNVVAMPEWRLHEERAGSAMGSVPASTSDATLSGSTRALPPKLPEYLQLSLVEAFFLMHSLDVLTVYDRSGQQMRRRACWEQFRRIQPHFAANFAVYHHLRSCGWVPKTGLKFGVDFLAYRRGPEYFHSSFAVLVRTMPACASPSATTAGGERDGARAMTWATLSNLNRLSSQVGKELMTCYVLVPPADPTAGAAQDVVWDATPDCLRGLRVQQTLMRRWIPEKTRHTVVE